MAMLSFAIIPASLSGVVAQVDVSPPTMVWPGVVIIVLIALFVTAAVTGPLIRANTDDTADAPPNTAPQDAGEE